jgi:hypothetical protein
MRWNFKFSFGSTKTLLYSVYLLFKHLEKDLFSWKLNTKAIYSNATIDEEISKAVIVIQDKVVKRDGNTRKKRVARDEIRQDSVKKLKIERKVKKDSL